MTQLSLRHVQAELDDQRRLASDLDYPKPVREAALRRVRQLEAMLGLPETPSYNGRPSTRPHFLRTNRATVADLLLIAGWGIALGGAMLLASPVATGIAALVATIGFLITLAGGMVR